MLERIYQINHDILKYNNNLALKNRNKLLYLTIYNYTLLFKFIHFHSCKEVIFHVLEVFQYTCETFHFLFHDSLVSFRLLQELTHLLLHFKYLRQTSTHRQYIQLFKMCNIRFSHSSGHQIQAFLETFKALLGEMQRIKMDMIRCKTGNFKKKNEVTHFF